MTGIVINQDDLPYWCIDVLHWLGMVKAMQEASGKIGNDYRDQLKMALETGAPVQYTNTKTGKSRWLSGLHTIYALYQDFCITVENEAKKAT